MPNPNHDERGRFASGPGGSTRIANAQSRAAAAEGARTRAIARREKRGDLIVRIHTGFPAMRQPENKGRLNALKEKAKVSFARNSIREGRSEKLRNRLNARARGEKSDGLGGRIGVGGFRGTQFHPSGKIPSMKSTGGGTYRFKE